MCSFPLCKMPDLCSKGIDLGVKPSAPHCPPTLLPYPGLQTEIQTASVSVETQSEIQTASVSGETQIEIQTVHIEAQTTPVSVFQTTLVSIETQTIEVRDEMEDRRQRNKENQVSPVYPGVICAEKPERLRNSHTSCCLFMKHSPGEIISL